MQRLSARHESYAVSLPCALVIASPEGAGAAQQALELAGLRFREPAQPHEVAARLSRQSLLDLLAVEAGSLTDADLAEILPQVEAVAAERRTRVVVALAPEQIETVAGALFATPATLLCEPTLAERVAALAIRRRPAVLHDNDRPVPVGEIARLSDEVERIARALARLSGDDADGGGVRPEKRLSTFIAPAGDAATIDPGQVRALIRARRLREQFFDREMLGEPGWDILLDLFAAEQEGLRVSVSSLCIAAAVPPTTALRWITGMTEAGMLQRHADPRDRRRAFITLAETASVAMRNYFVALQRQGLPLG